MAASLLAALVKKLTGLVDAVVPGVSVASCTKLRPFNGRSATCSDVMTCPSVGFAVSTATSVALTSTVEETDAGCRREIDFAMLVDLQPDVLLLGRLESLGLHANRVERDRQQRDQVMSGVVGLGFAREACALRGRPSPSRLTTTAPALSETVPEKLPLACPYRSGQAETASEKQPQPAAPSYSAFTPLFGGPAPNDEVHFPFRIETWEVVGP